MRLPALSCGPDTGSRGQAGARRRSQRTPTTDTRLAQVTARSFTCGTAGNVTFDTSTSAACSDVDNAANRVESFALGGVLRAECGHDAPGRQVIGRLTQDQKTGHAIHDLDGNRIAADEIDDLTGPR